MSMAYGGSSLNRCSFQPSIELLGIRTPLKEDGSEKPFATVSRNQAGAGPVLATPIPHDLLPAAGPAMGAIAGTLKAPLIQIDHGRRFGGSAECGVPGPGRRRTWWDLVQRSAEFFLRVDAWRRAYQMALIRSSKCLARS